VGEERSCISGDTETGFSAFWLFFVIRDFLHIPIADVLYIFSLQKRSQVAQSANI